MRNFLVLLFCLCLSLQIIAQTKSITGTVVDTNNEPIIGATVTEIGSANGTMVDIDGHFSLELAKPDSKITVSFLGYKSQTISPQNQSNLRIVMQEDSQILDEVIITGYGTSQKRSLMSNSISKLDDKVLKTSVMANAASSLQGTVSGLRVINTSGKPGSSPNIVLRGGASINKPLEGPLVVIDGIIRSLDDFNPSDIESIEVLKDAASTAIYGSRANNGVILVTTKKGKEGQAQVAYKFRGGPSYARKGYDFLNAEDYIYYNRLGYKRTGRAGIENQNGYGLNSGGLFSIAKMTNDNKQLLGEGWKSMTDPYDESQTLIFKDYGGQMREDAFNDPASMQDHYLSFSGGTEKGTFASTLGYYKEDGQVVGTNYERFSGTINGSYKINSILTVNAGGIFSQSSSPNLWTGNNSGETGEFELFYRSMSIWPTWNPYDEDGNPASGFSKSDGNPLYWKEKLSRKNKTRKTTFNIGAQLELIPKKLFLNENSSLYYVDYQFESFDKKFQLQNRATPDSNRESMFRLTKSYQVQHNATLTFTESFAKKHNLDAMIGGEIFENNYSEFSAAGRGAPSDDIPTLNVVSEKTSISSSKTDYKIVSAFSRINYNFNYRYMLSLVARYDGISKLSDNRWGFFPGISGGWNMHEEAFFKNSSIEKTVSVVKPRITYGTNGNVNGIGNFDVYGIYKTQTAYNENTGFLNTGVVNNNLRWEKSKTFGVGLDLGLLQNRIYLIFDYYNRKTEDLLTDLDLPGYTGFDSFKTNLGTIQNRGFEIEAKFNILNNPKGFSWDFSANAAFVSNKILKLPNNGLENNRQGGHEIYDPKSGKNIWAGGYQEGQQLGEIYAYKHERLFTDWDDIKANAANRYDAIGELYGPDAWNALANKTGKQQIEPGDVKWADLNNDGIINSYDRVKVGNIFPNWTGGFSSSLSFKNFSLYTRFDFVLGHTIYNDLKARSLGQYQGTFNIISEVKDSWSESNPNAKYPKFYYADQLSKKNITRSNNGGTALHNNSSLFYEKGDYLSLRELSLSYKLPKSLISKAYMSDMTLSVTGQNLFYITGYDGTSPEPAVDYQANGRGGIDNGRYPVPRSILFGIQVAF